MKIHLEHDGTILELERTPMPESRFRALCALGFAAIAGGVLLGLVHMVGIWGVAGALGALAMVGVYKAIQNA